MVRFGSSLVISPQIIANPPIGEYLEWIVIVLIAAEIVVAAINILVDLYAGVD